MLASLTLAALLAAAPSAQGQQPARTLTPQCCTATIRVRVPEGTGTLYLTGNLPELVPWRPDGRAMTGAGRELRIVTRKGVVIIPGRGTLLSRLMSAGVPVASSCSGRGSCGKCAWDCWTYGIWGPVDFLDCRAADEVYC